MDELASPLLHRSLLSVQLFPPRPLLPYASIPGSFRHSIAATNDHHSGQLRRVTINSIEPSSVTVTDSLSYRLLEDVEAFSRWLVCFFSPVDLRASLHPFALLLNPNSPSFGFVLRLNDNLSDMPGRIYHHNLFQNWKPFN